MKKFFGIGKKKKSGASPSPSETGSVRSAGYELREKDLSKLHRAASTGDVAKIRQLLHKHDVNQLDKENRTPLHLAAANGHSDAVKLLVENKAKLNLCDNDSRSPLIKAIQCQREHCATILLEHDADPNIVDVNGNSALHLAALIPSMAVAVQLLEHGANIDAENKDGCTPLVLAVTENNQEMVEFLSKEGASVNAKDKNGRTALMIAAGNGQISLVKHLLQSNADIFVKDETGWTADDHAVMNGHHACSHLIIEHGSKSKRPSSFYGGGKKGPSTFSSPDRVVEPGFSLGSPALNREELQVTSKQKSRKKDSKKGTEDISQADSESRISGKADSWPSSDEDDLDFSPKKTSKPSLTQLLNTKKSDKTKSKSATKRSVETHEQGEDEAEEREQENGDDGEVEKGNDQSEEEEEESEAVGGGDDDDDDEEDEEECEDGDDDDEAEEEDEEKESEEEEDDCDNNVYKDNEEHAEEEDDGHVDEETHQRCKIEVKLDANKSDYGQSNPIAQQGSKESMDAAHSEEEQVADETSDSNGVPVSLIYGLPENPDGNEASLDEGEVDNCFQTFAQTDQHIKDFNNMKGPKENLKISKGNDVTCLQGTHTNVCQSHEESFSGDEDQDGEDDESPQHSPTADTAGKAKEQAAGDVGRKVALMSELGFEDDDVESPWDSESASDSPRKQSASDVPPPPAPAHMQCISEESNEDTYYSPCFLRQPRSYKKQDEGWIYRERDVSEKCAAPEPNKPRKSVLHSEDVSSGKSPSKANEKNSKSDLMADLGLDDADDLEDASDWDSTSHSLKNSSTPRGFTQSLHKLNESTLPQTMHIGALPKETASLPPMTLSSVQEDTNEDHVQQKNDSIQNISKDISQESPNHKGLSNKKLISKDQNDMKSEHLLVAANLKKNPDKQLSSHQSLENLLLNIDDYQESSSDSEVPWEEKYEKLWVDHEKKDVKSHFKDITAELKQRFRELYKAKKKHSSKTSKSQEDSSHSCQDIQKHLKEEVGTSECPQKPVGPVMYPDSVDKDDKSFGNSESIDWSEDTKSKTQERIVGNSKQPEKYANPLSMQEKRKTPPTFSIANFHFLKPDSGNLGHVLQPADENVPCTKKKTDEEQPKQDSQQCAVDGHHIQNHLEGQLLQPKTYDVANKHLDKQLEQDMKLFKNEVGTLQREFVNLTRERSQLQKEVGREKTIVNRQMELETSKQSVDSRTSKQSDDSRPGTQLEADTQPKMYSKYSSFKEANGKQAVESVKHGPSQKSVHGQRGTKVASKQQRQLGSGDMLDKLEDSSETSQENGKRLTGKPVDEPSKVHDDDDDMDNFSQSSDSITEDFEVPTSAFRNAMLLIEQLNLDGQDSVNLLKIQNIIHEYERVIEKENRRHALLSQEVKKLREERKELQQMTEKNRELKSLLEYNKVEWDSDVSSLRSNLKQEEEKRKSAEMLQDMSKEQLRRKEEQCRKEMEEKQQLELTLRNLELEIRSLRNNMKQIEEERNESQRLYAQEHSSRLLQEEAFNNIKRRNEEEEKRRLHAKSVEVLSQPSETNEKVKDLTQKNIALHDEVSLLKQELDQVQSHYREEESRYLEEVEALKEKNDDLRKDLKVNEDTLTQTVIQYNGQLNALKTDMNMLCSKLEIEKQNKERLETELESARSRLNSALQDLERNQASKTDSERTFQRERDEWLRSKDKQDHDLSNLRENNNNLSQQLSRAEAKSNSLENDLHRTNLSLQEKTVLLDSSQRDVKQAQSRIKDLEKALQTEKDQVNKSTIKQETLQERVAQITSENMQLRQQLEDAQNKGIIKEKAVSDVQDRFSDIFSKLRADSERQVQIVEERNKDLINKSNELREQVYKLETEKVERESTIRQLQQELADGLKKLSMSEASLEVITRYRNDLEEEKQHLHKELEKLRTKVQDIEEQFLQSERRNHQLKNLLDDKEREVITAFQKVQELSSATAGSEKSVKQLEEHIQKLEIENAKFEATAKQQSIQIETLQKELQESISIRNRLEDLITNLQTSKIGLEEKLNQHVHKQTVLSQSAQDSQNLWEEELKSRSRLGVRLAELEQSKADLVEQVENEKKKVKKLLDQKKSMEERFDQEIKRNSDLQRDITGLKKLLKSAKKKLKELEADERHQGKVKDSSHRGHHETDNEVFTLKKKIEELSLQLERESRNYMQLEASNRDLHEQLSSVKNLHKNHERLERSKREMEDEVAELRRHIGSSKMDQSYLEQYKREIDERGRQELRQKLEEVNLFLQAQAASKDKLEQMRAENDATVRNQLEHRIQDLECELNKIKNIQEESMSQKDSSMSELQRVKDLYTEEQKIRKSLGSKLERANERLAEANTKLLNERQRSKSLIASSFLHGSLPGSPLLDASSLGGLGSSPALSRSLGLGGSFLNSVGSGLTANEMGAYFTKMQLELEKNITKELDQANAELDTGCTRVSPVGSIAGSMRNLSGDQDLVSQARQQYLEVLKKNYKI
ncbi:ankyrin repeat domain-containing protein 26 isoform X2 [Hyperolius riggenbachi]|uniref:ankyrin repeat domain-containing protein 26 isoform X2 n=1 Tax=Hyperolius riggenbachi TaxID=752182 RepID=UPI0035A36B42